MATQPHSPQAGVVSSSTSGVWVGARQNTTINNGITMEYCDVFVCSSGYSTVAASAQTTNDMIMSTLCCQICDRVFMLPVSTCIDGHVMCSACVAPSPFPHARCGKCYGPIMAYRNEVIEKQLSMLSVNCFYSQCGRIIRACDIYTHKNDCEFRPIQCFYRLPDGRDCSETVSFGSYFDHLLIAHYSGNDPSSFDTNYPDGFIPCNFSAKMQTVEHIFNPIPSRDIGAGAVWPIVLIKFNRGFIVNSYVRGKLFYFWVRAMESEAEATQYSASFRLADKHYYNHNAPAGYRDFPKVGIHNVNTLFTCQETQENIVKIPYSDLRDFNCNFRCSQYPIDEYHWTVLVKIDKKDPEVEVIHPEPEEESQYGEDEDENEADHDIQEIIQEPENHEIPEDHAEPDPEPEEQQQEDFGDLIIVE